MAFSDTILYAVEGQENAGVYSFSLSSDVEYPADVVVSLPPGMPQGSIALYDSATQSIVGDLGTELMVSLTDAADSSTMQNSSACVDFCLVCCGHPNPNFALFFARSNRGGFLPF